MLFACETAAQCAVARVAICVALGSAASVSGKRRSRAISQASSSRVGKRLFVALKGRMKQGAFEVVAIASHLFGPIAFEAS